MAFILPLLLMLIFGIAEFGYMIYAYSTVSQAARNAAEAAAQLPPYQSWIDQAANPPAGFPGLRADDCVNGIYTAAETDATLFNGGSNQGRQITNYLTITYPNGASTRNLSDRGPIQITIAYPVTGITPLFRLLNFGGSTGTVTLSVTQRRSLESLGNNPNKPGGVACAKDYANWKELNGL
jgi:hypothetical protein